jgi:hypothetical protein
MSRSIPGSERFVNRLNNDPAVVVHKSSLAALDGGRITAGGRVATTSGVEPFHPREGRPTLDTYLRNKQSDAKIPPLTAANPFASNALTDQDSFRGRK